MLRDWSWGVRELNRGQRAENRDKWKDKKIKEE